VRAGFGRWGRVWQAMGFGGLEWRVGACSGDAERGGQSTRAGTASVGVLQARHVRRFEGRYILALHPRPRVVPGASRLAAHLHALPSPPLARPRRPLAATSTNKPEPRPEPSPALPSPSPPLAAIPTVSPAAGKVTDAAVRAKGGKGKGFSHDCAHPSTAGARCRPYPSPLSSPRPHPNASPRPPLACPWRPPLTPHSRQRRQQVRH